MNIITGGFFLILFLWVKHKNQDRLSGSPHSHCLSVNSWSVSFLSTTAHVWPQQEMFNDL